MDFKNVLEEWKNYQKHKLVMANLYPCTVTLADGYHVHGNLSFINTGESRRIKCFDPDNKLTWTLLLSRILGTSPERSTIRFTLTCGRIIIIRFSSERIQTAAHEAFMRFGRKEFGPTPSSSSSNKGD